MRQYRPGPLRNLPIQSLPRRLLRPRASGGFSPTNIADMALWLDAADAATVSLDASSNVEQWNDKSGNGRHAGQTTAANRPDYASTLNGKSVVGFSGSPEVLTGAQIVSGAATPTVFVVGRATGTNAQECFVNLSSDSATVGGHFNVTFEPGLRIIGGATTFAGASIVTESIFTLGVSNPSVGDAYCYVNGDERSVSSTGVTSINLNGTQYSVGAGGAGFAASYFLNGIVAEILVYTRVLTDAERQRVESYLSAKWGIALA